MATSSDPFAPGSLELVRRFVNTRDLEKGTDSLLDPSQWDAWCHEQKVPAGSSAESRALMRELREGLRAGFLANHDRAPMPTPTLEALNAALAWSSAVPAFTSEGLALQPTGDGARHVVTALIQAVDQSLRDGSWSRMKACLDDACQWAFYDHSRSRTGQWCSMEICGNRNKQSRWRSRQIQGARPVR